LPNGIKFNEATGIISGEALGSGARHQEISQFTITAKGTAAGVSASSKKDDDVSLKVGTLVCLKELTTQPALNGLTASILGFDSTTRRYTVEYENTSSSNQKMKTQISVRPCSLAPLDTVTASFNLVLQFIETPLRDEMGLCLVCDEPIQDKINARAAACSAKSADKPHGIHAYCHECFNAMIMALQVDAIPLVCTACKDSKNPQKADVLFEDSQIMDALSDQVRVRYVALYKAKQKPGTVRISCNQRGCNWVKDEVRLYSFR
jgi:hypothetical protein